MYNIVGAMFNSEDEARQALNTLAETPSINGTTIYQISLVKRKNGELKLCDNFTSEYLTSLDTVKGGLIGGLLGLLGGPISALVAGAAGALIGKTVDANHKVDSKSLIAQVAERLEESDMALIMLVDEENEGILDHMMVKYDTVPIRYTAEAIAKEVEANEQQKQAEEQAKAEEKKD